VELIATILICSLCGSDNLGCAGDFIGCLDCGDSAAVVIEVVE
jgi:hypothetical protein